jgi:hypothetical protein
MPILWQPNEGKHSSIYIHHPTNPNPRGNLLKSQEHVQVTLRHTQTYVSTWCNACWWHESDNLHTNPSVSQRTRTFTNHHPTYTHPPPTNQPTCKHKTTKPSCTLNLPHPSTSTSPPSLHHTVLKRKFGTQKSMKSYQEIASGPKKHEISYAKLVTAQRSMKSHKEISSEKCAAKRDTFHKDIS